eukprot:1160142-Pelagomonas_calceolata.AAC.6
MKANTYNCIPEVYPLRRPSREHLTPSSACTYAPRIRSSPFPYLDILAEAALEHSSGVLESV